MTTTTCSYIEMYNSPSITVDCYGEPVLHWFNDNVPYTSSVAYPSHRVKRARVVYGNGNVPVNGEWGECHSYSSVWVYPG